MPLHRRDFLKKGGMLASGIALGSYAAGAMDWKSYKKLDKFGLQLWTVKDQMILDPVQTIKSVASYGYEQIEGFEGDKGIFWGMTNTEFKKLTDDLGISFISSHAGISNADGAFEKKAEQAAAIGIKYLICPFYGAQKTLDGYKTAADTFNDCGKICKKNGIRFAYHNHWYSFEVQEGIHPQEILLKNTDPELVDFEMDIYWVVTAGSDPTEWLSKYPGRFRLCHIKDRKIGAVPGNHDASCILGTGSIDFKSIAAIAKANGMKYYIVEQEQFDGSTLDAAKADAAYMKNFEV